MEKYQGPDGNRGSDGIKVPMDNNLLINSLVNENIMIFDELIKTKDLNKAEKSLRKLFK